MKFSKKEFTKLVLEGMKQALDAKGFGSPSSAMHGDDNDWDGEFDYHFYHGAEGVAKIFYKEPWATQGSRDEEPWSEDLEIVKVEWKGHKVSLDELLELFNALREKDGDTPVTYEELVEDIEKEIKAHQSHEEKTDDDGFNDMF